MSKSTNQDSLNDIMNEIENNTCQSMQSDTDIIEKTLKMSQWKCIANDCEGNRPIMNGCDLWCTICKADREGKRDLFYLIGSIESKKSTLPIPYISTASTAIIASPILKQKEPRKIANIKSASYHTLLQENEFIKYRGQDSVEKDDKTSKLSHSKVIKTVNEQKKNEATNVSAQQSYSLKIQSQIETDTKKTVNGLSS